MDRPHAGNRTREVAKDRQKRRCGYSAQSVWTRSPCCGPIATTSTRRIPDAKYRRAHNACVLNVLALASELSRSSMRGAWLFPRDASPFITARFRVRAS